MNSSKQHLAGEKAAKGKLSVVNMTKLDDVLKESAQHSDENSMRTWYYESKRGVDRYQSTGNIVH